MEGDQHIPQHSTQNGHPQPGINQQQPLHQFPPPPSAQSTGNDGLLYNIFQHLQHQQAAMNQMLQQQQLFFQQQEERFQRAFHSINPEVPANPELILDSLASNIHEFRYDADSHVTFGAWYSRYDDLFARDAQRLDDGAKVRLLLRKLGSAEHDRYVSFILPALPKDFSFDQTVRKLKSLFGAKESVISRRYRCLQMSKNPVEDFVSYTCRVNKSCVEFELGKLNENQFKCLMFVCGLKSESDAEIRTRLLSRIEENDDVTLEQLSEECQRIISLKQDAAMIEASKGPPETAIHAIKQGKPHRPRRSRSNSPTESESSSSARDVPSSPCWNCGSMHYARHCKYKSHKCGDCGKLGHKEGYCISAKKSSNKKNRSLRNVDSKVVSLEVDTVRSKRRYATVGLNGHNIDLQFDTASDVSIISSRTWNKIGKPALRPASVCVMTASDESLQLKGEITCNVTINGKSKQAVIRVADAPIHLLGADLIDAFNLGSLPIDAFCRPDNRQSFVSNLLRIVRVKPPRSTAEMKKQITAHRKPPS